MGIFSDIIGTLSNSFKVGKLTLSSSALSVARTVAFPDKAGTVAMLDDVSGGSITLATAVATTSGTSHDFTSIPAGTNRITIMLSGVSTNGASLLQIQLGDSGGVETTGYSGNSALLLASSYGNVAYSTGFMLDNTSQPSSATVRSGKLVLDRISGNVWIASGMTAYTNTTTNHFYAGAKTLSDELDRVRLTTANGTDTFDAGSWSISYE